MIWLCKSLRNIECSHSWRDRRSGDLSVVSGLETVKARLLDSLPLATLEVAPWSGSHSLKHPRSSLTVAKTIDWKIENHQKQIDVQWTANSKMGLKFGGMVSLLTIFVGPRTEAWTENDCSSSSKSNDLKTSALLYAHRCYLKVSCTFLMPCERDIFGL